MADDLLPLKETMSYYHALIVSDERALEWVRAAVLTDGPRWVARDEEGRSVACAAEVPPTPPGASNVSPAELRAAVENATSDPLSVSPENMLLVYNDEYRIVYRPRLNWFMIELIAPPFEGAQVQAEQGLVRLLGLGPQTACSLSVTVVDGTGAKLPLTLCQ